MNSVQRLSPIRHNAQRLAAWCSAPVVLISLVLALLAATTALDLSLAAGLEFWSFPLATAAFAAPVLIWLAVALQLDTRCHAVRRA